ncbi:phage scaffolding protein [Leuconostoc pseudomesenteroides]|uniref:phage scaffolding protein n=1 Tax=Leuconostoc pseudomesenteroides TaxID=33968 RepID=UPI00403D998A
MKTEQLKELGLTEEQVGKVFKLHGDDLNATKQQLATAEQERDSYKSQVDDVTNQLTEAQKHADEGSDLKTQLSDLQTQLADAKTNSEQQLEATKLDYEIVMALGNAGVRGDTAVKAVKSLLDKDTIKLSNGKVTGLNEQLDGLKSDDSVKSLFGDVVGEQQPPKPNISAGGNPNPNGKPNIGGDSIADKIAANMAKGN